MLYDETAPGGDDSAKETMLVRHHERFGKAPRMTSAQDFEPTCPRPWINFGQTSYFLRQRR